ncbi:MAG: aryl-sulfate sulfotransferase [Acidobacteriota bacterium]
MNSFRFIAMIVAASGAPLWASIQLQPDLPSPQPVGTPVTWTISGTGRGNFDNRLTVARDGEAARVLYDFTLKNGLEWTPIEEGSYLVKAFVRDLASGEITEVSAPFEIESRVTLQPVATGTDHPLVVLFSSPPCEVGKQMRVRFNRLSAPGLLTRVTHFKVCSGDRSMNFYLGGLRERSFYIMRAETQDIAGSPPTLGPEVLHLTGTISIEKPDLTVLDPPDRNTSLENILLQSPAGLADPDGSGLPMATDLKGRIIWYYSRDLELSPMLIRPVSGGTFLFHLDDAAGVRGEFLREVDLAGRVVRETNAARINEQIQAMGFTDPFTAFHHEARRLPNGHTVTLGYTERLVEDVQGPGWVDVLGDYIVDLDENFQLTWAWSAYDHLDLSRLAILGEKCRGSNPGCPDLVLDDKANDWTHSNALAYSPLDGNLVLSMRHQDWVIKIDFQEGAGSGNVLWKLGVDGDFILQSDDPFPFFSHGHDVNVDFGDLNRIIYYDNGNTRCASQPDPCVSRGQVYALDESTLTASLVLNVDLPGYSVGAGSAQALLNGNYHFDSGFRLEGLDLFATADSLTPEGTFSYSLRTPFSLYRSFRMGDLYTTADWFLMKASSQRR